MTTEEKRHELEKIAEETSTCQKCRLCKTAKQAVPGVGNPDADILFIGEAPGFYEDQQGEPFVGRAGKLLDFLLSQIGMSRQEVYIANIIKHRPPENRDPLPDEIESCKPFLTRQIEIIQPKVIATLGRFSMMYFLPDAKISNVHGQVVPLMKYAIYPLYHPAAALRNPKMKTALISDFLKLPEVVVSLGGKAGTSPSATMTNTTSPTSPEKGVPPSNSRARQIQLFT